MEHALNIPEIRMIIFKPQSQSTLTRLALVSRSFSNSALDILYDVCALDDLLQVLPRDLWRIDENSSKFTFIRPLQTKDWLGRFTHYSPRVKTLLISFSRLTETILSLIALSAPSPLLPSLKTLNVINMGSLSARISFWTYIPMFIPRGHPIESIHLSCFYFSQNIPSSAELELLEAAGLDLLTKNAPSVREFRLWANPSHQVFPEILRGALERWQWLQSLTLLGISVSLDGVLVLSNLRSLSTLDFTMPEWAPEDGRLASGFPVLETLSVDASVAACISLLQAITSPNFRNFTWKSPSDTALSMFDALVNILAPEAICNLSLSVTFHSNTDHVPIIESDLSCLHKFVNMERLTLTFDDGFNLNNEDLRNIIKKFPLLDQLSLGPASPSPWNVDENPSSITLDALLVIAKEFPRLKNLLLPISLSGPPPSIPGDFTSSSELISLTLDPSSDLDFSPGTCAAYLVRLFPHLRAASLARASLEEDTWVEVSRIMGHLIEARERGWKEAEMQRFREALELGSA
ncbi:hypothetical protein DL96DRAFT_244960 [Flagelloscypha sp. PMI_526]|nr:hypothetical protein DL96DRAFT_244960 [Flagelloscypha sp. PMI_526]